MNKRIIKKIYDKNIKKAEQVAIKKLKERYILYQVKKGVRKGDLIKKIGKFNYNYLEIKQVL